MSGRHRRPSSVPAALIVVLVLLLLAGGALAARALLEGPNEANHAATGGGDPSASASVPASSPTSPEPSEGPSPDRSPAEKPEPRRKGRLVIRAVGDVSVDPNWIPTYRTQGYGYAWSGLDGLFRKDDLTIINLECTVSNRGSPVPKEFNFRGPPESLGPMKAAGIEVANLGNNHAYDYGAVALLDSRKFLLEAGIQPVGAGKDAAEALSPALFDIKGWRIAVVGIDQVVDPYPEAVATEEKPGTAAGHDRDAMVQAIRGADRQADLVIVTVHWGVELDTEPRDYMVEDANLFVDAGADIIFGHHSHRVNPIGWIEGKPVLWGLGHFVWRQLSEESRVTTVGEVVVTKKGKMQARLLPAYIEDDGHPVLTG